MAIQGHQGSQLASHILTRATIQTAVALATALGTATSKRGKAIYYAWFKKKASELMLGSLLPSLINMDIVEIDLSGKDKRSETARFKKNRKELATKDPLLKFAHSLEDDDEWHVDLVLSPLDGANALREGASGSVSSAAGGKRGCFKMRHGAANEYFVIALGKSILDAEMSTALEPYEARVVKKTEALSQFLRRYRLIDDVLKVLQRADVPPVVALTSEGPYKGWTPTIKSWHRKRWLEGSVVASALAVFTGKVPCAMFASRRSQVMQAAIAAKGLGGRLYAIPLCKPKTVKEGNILRADDFVRGDNAVLCCTSVSEVCVLDRVRFGFDQTAKTDSIIVSLATGRITRQSDMLDLNRTRMRNRDGEAELALKLLHGFRDELKHELQSRDTQKRTGSNGQTAQGRRRK